VFAVCVVPNQFKKGMVVAGLAANGMGAFSGLSLPAMK